MGKASSNKKVARAAKAGGGRARAAGERNLLFPVVLAAVVVVGTLLVVYARDQRTAEALEAPVAFEDHWHSAYGFYVCDEFLPDLPEFTAPQNGGNHTHGDGLIHVHPFSTARSGENATLVNWIVDAGAVLGGGDMLRDDRLGVPGGDTYVEGESTCDGVEGDPIVQVAVWDDAADAVEGNDPDRVLTENFRSILMDNDSMAYTIAFAPEGTELPPPPTVERLAEVSAENPYETELPEDFGTDEGTDPGDGTEADPGSEGDAESDAGDAESETGDAGDTGAGEDADPGDDTSATTEPES